MATNNHPDIDDKDRRAHQFLLCRVHRRSLSLSQPVLYYSGVHRVICIQDVVPAAATDGGADD